MRRSGDFGIALVMTTLHSPIIPSLHYSYNALEQDTDIPSLHYSYNALEQDPDNDIRRMGDYLSIIFESKYAEFIRQRAEEKV